MYWLGPGLGALLAVAFYRYVTRTGLLSSSNHVHSFVKALEYEVYGAIGQDADHLELGSTSGSTTHLTGPE